MSRCIQAVIVLAVCTAVHLQAAPSAAYVGICCNAPSTVNVFNTASLIQKSIISTGSGGDGIVLSPDGAKMFVTVDYKRQLQVIATATGAVLAVIPVPISVSGEPPLELAIRPDGSRVYVFAPQNQPEATLLAVDTTTYRVTQANLPDQGSIGPLLISPDGTQLYYETGYANEEIQVVDTATLAPLKQIPINQFPSDLAVTPSGLILMTDTSNQLLVVDPRSSAVTVFPLANNGQGTPAIVISSPDSTTAYISFASQSILAVDIATGETVFDAPISYTPTHFAISQDGTSLYSTNLSSIGAWSLAEFGIPAQKPLKETRQLGPLTGLVLTQDGRSLYVLNANQSDIASVGVNSQKLMSITPAGAGINSLAIPPGSNNVWASQYSFGLGGDIVFLNPLTNQVKYVAGISGALSFSPDGKVVYVVNPPGVTAYDTASLKPLGRAYVGQLTNAVQAIPSPDGARLYISASFVSGISNGGGEFFAPGEILVLDTSTFKYTAAINVADGMGSLALTPDGSTLVYTSNFGRVHLASTATNKITATIHLMPATGLLNGLVLSSDASKAYVADSVNNLLLVASLPTQTQQASVAVGASPLEVVLTPDGSEAWLTTFAGLEVVNTATGEVSSVALPGAPSAIVFAQ